MVTKVHFFEVLPFSSTLLDLGKRVITIFMYFFIDGSLLLYGSDGAKESIIPKSRCILVRRNKWLETYSLLRYVFIHAALK